MVRTLSQSNAGDKSATTDETDEDATRVSVE